MSSIYYYNFIIEIIIENKKSYLIKLQQKYKIQNTKYKI